MTDRTITDLARPSRPQPLTAAHDLSSFDCGQLELNDWLRERALKNEGRHARTYVICSDTRVVGFYAIAAGMIERASAPGWLQRNAPEKISVSIIGRLAVDFESHGKGIGGDLLSDALTRIAFASQTLGIRAVLVQAMDDQAKSFYMAHANFLEHPANSRTLILPIEALLAELP